MARKNRAGRRDPAWEVLRRGLPATRSPETVRRADGGGVSWLSAPARWIEGSRSCSPLVLDPHGSWEGRRLLAEDVEEQGRARSCSRAWSAVMTLEDELGWLRL